MTRTTLPHERTRPRAGEGASRRPAPAVRPLVPDDMGAVARLHARVFARERNPDQARAFLTEVFFGHPWRDDELRSLKLVGSDGALIGCLGIMPRAMRFDGEAIRAVATHNFIVDPEHWGGLTAIRLMRAAVELGGDLVISDSTEAIRRMAEALGAEVLTNRSMRWFRIFRPTQLALQVTGAEALPARAHRMLRAMGTKVDRIAAAVPGLSVGAPESDGLDEPIEPSLLLDLLQRWSQDVRLRPVYTVESLTWLLTTLADSRRPQTLRARVARVRHGGDPIGWYVYYSRPGRVGRVLQMGAAPDCRGPVLDRLFADALAQGNVGVAGQLDPGWVDDLCSRYCLMWPGRTWVLAHTRDPELREVLDTPRAHLGRLEGEGWLRFGF